MNRKTKASLLMVVSAMFFALMQIVIALTAQRIPLFQQLFFRNLIAALVAAIGIHRQGLHYWGHRKHRTLLILRSIFGFLGMIGTFYASGTGNQGDVSTILKMSPFVVTVLAFFFLKETITPYQITALLVAFVGVFFVSNPQFNSDLTSTLVAASACLFAGTAYTFVGALKGKESPEVIIFFFSAFSTLATVPFMLANFVVPTLFELAMLLLIGLFAALGQITLTYSYAYAKASEVSIYNYTGIVFSMLFGFAFLGQTVKPTSLLGAALVIFAGGIVFWGSNRSAHRPH